MPIARSSAFSAAVLCVLHSKTRSATRARISSAALLVKVIASMELGQVLSSNSLNTREINNQVLPVPADA